MDKKGINTKNKEIELIEKIKIYNQRLAQSEVSDKYLEQKLEDLKLGLSFQRKYRKFKEREK